MQDQVHRKSGKNERFFHYPPDIRRYIVNINFKNELPDNCLQHIPSTGWSPGTGPTLASWTIPLATYSLPYRDLNWHLTEKDPEDLFALHRFGWLLRWLSLRPNREGLADAESVIIDWIAGIGPEKSTSAWETYSACERVVNWLICFCATSKHHQYSDKALSILAGALLDHLNHITRHLEYYGRSCNNHILNNARALYIGGRFLQLPQIAELGRILFTKHIPELIDRSGMLIEGSSHYQHLLTRSLFEVMWAAEATADLDFYRNIKKVVLPMLQCCAMISRSFTGNKPDDFPRIGDISPDFPISWFSPVSRQNNHSETWWRLWDSAFKERLTGADSNSFSSQHSAGDWHIVSSDNDGSTVMVYAPSGIEIYPASHGHLDFGGFSFYDEHGEVLVDRGRYSYQTDDFSTYGYTAKAHNTTLINGLPLVPESRGLYFAYKEYLAKDTFIKVRNKKNQRLSWRTKAVNRFSKNLRWHRDLDLHIDGITVNEWISNPDGRVVFIESYFHLAPGWGVHPVEKRNDNAHCFDLIKDGRSYRISIDVSDGRCMVKWIKGHDSFPDGWHFSDYGVKLTALTLKLYTQIDTNFTIQWDLRLI
jgi:heparinase II/III-like protein